METLRDQLMSKLGARPRVKSRTHTENTEEVRCQGCGKVVDTKIVLMETALHNARYDVDFCDECVIRR